MQNEQQSAKHKLRELNMDLWTPSCLEKIGVTDFVSHLQFQEALYALCKGRPYEEALFAFDCVKHQLRRGAIIGEQAITSASCRQI